jgi:oligoendopeptidase F
MRDRNVAERPSGASKKGKGDRVVWDLRSLFAGDDDPAMDKKIREVEKESMRFIDKWKDSKEYLNEPSVLRQALDEYEQWRRRFGTDGDAGYYFWLRTQQDQNDPALKAKFNKIEEFSRRIENGIQFFSLRIAKIPRGRQKKFLDYEGLRPYRHFLDRIFAGARYLLSEPEEKIVNLKEQTSS